MGNSLDNGKKPHFSKDDSDVNELSLPKEGFLLERKERSHSSSGKKQREVFKNIENKYNEESSKRLGLKKPKIQTSKKMESVGPSDLAGLRRSSFDEKLKDEFVGPQIDSEYGNFKAHNSLEEDIKIKNNLINQDENKKEKELTPKEKGEEENKKEETTTKEENKNMINIEESKEDNKEEEKKEPSIENKIKDMFKDIRPKNESNNDNNKDYDIYNTEHDYELNFYRSGDGIRKSYIAKLVYKNVLIPNHVQKTHNSLIIFDWDDTLLPTTFLTPGGSFNENIELSEKDKEKISKLETNVNKLLNLAVNKGDVYIITNAGVGWVEYSAERFYPSVIDLLTKKVHIISARGEFEEKYPNDSRRWKIQTFLNLQKNLDVGLVTNIICLGDSIFEMEAGRILASKFTQAFIKTIKFREGPKPEELNKQLTLVLNQFNTIYSAVKNLTIRVEKKKKKDE